MDSALEALEELIYQVCTDECIRGKATISYHDSLVYKLTKVLNDVKLEFEHMKRFKNKCNYCQRITDTSCMFCVSCYSDVLDKIDPQKLHS